MLYILLKIKKTKKTNFSFPFFIKKKKKKKMGVARPLVVADHPHFGL